MLILHLYCVYNTLMLNSVNRGVKSNEVVLGVCLSVKRYWVQSPMSSLHVGIYSQLLLNDVYKSTESALN